jgi:hypothetical protein
MGQTHAAKHIDNVPVSYTVYHIKAIEIVNFVIFDSPNFRGRGCITGMILVPFDRPSPCPLFYSHSISYPVTVSFQIDETNRAFALFRYQVLYVVDPK